MLDAHCHLDDPRADRGEARRAGVEGWLCAGYSPSRWEVQAAISDAWHAFGLHPWAVAEVDDESAKRRPRSGFPAGERLDDLVALPSFLVGAVAVGEIGLDRTRANLPLQALFFRCQVALARERGLPVVLHVVRCHGKALEILRADGVSGGMLHGFRGPAEVLPAWLELGFSISLGEHSPPFPQLPEDRLLLETDGPSGGSLAGLPATVTRIAAARGVSPSHLERVADANLRRLIGK